MSRCDNCGGEDCICCEVFLERQADDRYNEQYEPDEFEPISYDEE
jgi:hypothetical protein